MDKIVQIIQDILKYTDKNNCISNSLNKGLSPLEIEQKLKDFPFKLPQEAKQLYQWHNGTNIYDDVQIFYYHYLLNIEESLNVYHSWIEENQSHDWIIYPEHLFPLLGFEGEYYAIACSSEQQETGKIWHIYHENICVYNSLYFMFKSFLECYEKEAYKMILVDGYWETEEDQKMVAKIKLKHNPIRQTIVTELEKRGENDYFSYP
ncbi:MAG: SMI1/KNR4 family protein [Cyanobacterium sp.]